MALVCISIAARLVPLTFSPLPLGIDGFGLTRISSNIAATGTWRIDPAGVISYNEKLPGFSILWADVSLVAGLSPLIYAQLIVPLITGLAVIPAYLLGVKATGRRLGGFVAGLFIAVFGSFLLLTSSVAKESIGLLVFPVALLLFSERRDVRNRTLAFVLLLLLPFLHPLTTLLTLGGVASLVVFAQRRAIARGRFSPGSFALDVATGPLLAVPAWAYYSSVQLPYLADILAPDALVLFLGIVVLVTALLLPMARPAKRRIGQGLASPITRALVPPAIGVAVVLGDGETSLFAGAVGTQPGLIEVLPAIFVLTAFVLAGYQLLRRTTNRANDLVVSMLAAPVALILFGFLRGLDPQSLVIVYRSIDFLDYAFAVLAAAGFVLAWKRLKPWRFARAALAAGFVAALIATTPMAWNTPAVFGVQNVTTADEFHALAFLASLHPRNVTSDQRLADIGAMWFAYTTDPSLPVKLRDNKSVAGFDYAIVLERWTTEGAQVHPAPNVVLATTILTSFLEGNRVSYEAGPAGDRIFIVQILETT
jgi:hypothetical protein